MYSIDRIEGEYAVLEQDGRLNSIPLAELPDGVREGDLLEKTADGGWCVRIDETKDRRLHLGSLRRRLTEEKA